MPTYEYVCGACGRHFDGQAAIAERDRVQTCPSCGKQEGRRVMTACAVKGGARGSACASCSGKNCGSCH